MRPRGFTVVEVMVGSGVLLLMVALASMATISYLRGYGHYTREGAKLRLAAKTLEVVCFELRSARKFKTLPKSLQQGSVEFENSARQACSLQLRAGQLWVRHAQQQTRLGAAADLQFSLQGDLLQISVPVGGQPPLTSAIPLRGVAR